MRLRELCISLRLVKRLRRRLTAPQAPSNLPRLPEKVLVVIRSEVVNVQHSAGEYLVIEEAVRRLEVEQGAFDRVSGLSVGFVPGFPFLKSLQIIRLLPFRCQQKDILPL